MHRKHSRLALALLALGASVAAVAGSTQAAAPATQTYTVDMAMDGTTFFFEGGVTDDTQVPLNGTPFIVSGYLYPAGTFDLYGELSGVNDAGGPAFPELMIGTFSCRGWHLQDGDAESGPVVATQHIFDFDLSRPGSQMLTGDGMELAGFGVPFDRALTGGTGRFRNVRGPYHQTTLGGSVNNTGGFNAEFNFELPLNR